MKFRSTLILSLLGSIVAPSLGLPKSDATATQEVFHLTSPLTLTLFNFGYTLNFTVTHETVSSPSEYGSASVPVAGSSAYCSIPWVSVKGPQWCYSPCKNTDAHNSFYAYVSGNDAESNLTVAIWQDYVAPNGGQKHYNGTVNLLASTLPQGDWLCKSTPCQNGACFANSTCTLKSGSKGYQGPALGSYDGFLEDGRKCVACC
ncbi:hypothetical protein K470DRAFT_258097 [Piedraia hortae CBS 480.64]|uniref:Uncharacterized protein n=1 Tax=Piedraia hortae CBS 480.64 TaxID=1314780 RepID=A0A6A7BZC4_9PEZI|nr:hypothetical protein K470DRAFT_258097 [Piedraia hortae CBS 480.64]